MLRYRKRKHKLPIEISFKPSIWFRSQAEFPSVYLVVRSRLFAGLDHRPLSGQAL